MADIEEIKKAAHSTIEEERRALTRPNAKAAPEKKPLFRETGEAEPYPTAALGDLAYVAEAAGRMVQAPASIIAQSCISAVVLPAQAHVDVNFGFGRRPASVFLYTSGVSGERKTSSDNEVLNAPAEFQKRLLLDQQANDEEDALSPIMLPTDPTVDALIGHLAKSRGTVVVLNSDAGAFFGGHAFGRDTATASAAKLSGLWDGTFAASLRVAGNRLVTGQRASLSLMAQPFVTAALLDPDGVVKGQGFLSRCLISEPTSKIGTRMWVERDPADEELMETFHAYIAYLLEQDLPLEPGTRNVLAPREVRLDGAAYGWLKGFAEDVERNCADGKPWAAVRDFASKAPEHAARLAAILGFYGDPYIETLSVEQIDCGVTLAGYYLREIDRLTGKGSEDRDLQNAAKLLACMQKRGSAPVSGIEIYQRGPEVMRTAAAMRKYIEILVDHNWVRKVPGPVEFDGMKRHEAYELT
jgi:hypothetical protein